MFSSSTRDEIQSAASRATISSKYRTLSLDSKEGILKQQKVQAKYWIQFMAHPHKKLKYSVFLSQEFLKKITRENEIEKAQFVKKMFKQIPINIQSFLKEIQ